MGALLLLLPPPGPYESEHDTRTDEATGAAADGAGAELFKAIMLDVIFFFPPLPLFPLCLLAGFS